MAELVDARDLKSRGTLVPCRFEPGFRHQNRCRTRENGFETVVLRFCSLSFLSYRGVEQLVARRAHNPKVVGSSPSPATKRSPDAIRVRTLFFLS